MDTLILEVTVGPHTIARKFQLDELGKAPSFLGEIVGEMVDKLQNKNKTEN